MSYQIYLILHFTGILLVFLAFGSMIARSALQPGNVAWRKFGGITSGIGLVLILVGGFGMLARLHLGAPGWAMMNTGIWLALGVMTALINKKPQAAKPLWFVTLALGIAAVVTVTYKPLADVGIKHSSSVEKQVEEALDQAKEKIQDAVE